MRTRGLATLRLLSPTVVWEKDGRCKVDVPPEIARQVREDRATMLAVLRRAAVFYHQLATPSADPFVRLRAPRKWTAKGSCPSCGGELTEKETLRCDLCALGVELALEGSQHGAEREA
jgi:hypothetical protein